MNPLRSYTPSTSTCNVTELISWLQTWTFPSLFSPPTWTWYYNDLPSGWNLHSLPAMTSSGFESSWYPTPLARSMHSPSASGASTTFDTLCFPTRREGRHFSLSPLHVSPPPHSEFHLHLYPGSVHHAAQTMAVNKDLLAIPLATPSTSLCCSIPFIPTRLHWDITTMVIFISFTFLFLTFKLLFIQPSWYLRHFLVNSYHQFSIIPPLCKTL